MQRGTTRLVVGMVVVAVVVAGLMVVLGQLGGGGSQREFGKGGFRRFSRPSE